MYIFNLYLQGGVVCETVNFNHIPLKKWGLFYSKHIFNISKDKKYRVN